ncbi:uncharacterized protein RSE6_08569 [Rhynchosporium secalis]|uniref:Uncharacterized protein n=1 Tax=Rhynchosporium secalis TaxID=38038 RepID=A0A1E1MFQ5_RHYSE|nr:uncharacterized protein RSE6_08569 [Rhynchosporium secalis]
MSSSSQGDTTDREELHGDLNSKTLHTIGQASVAPLSEEPIRLKDIQRTPGITKNRHVYWFSQPGPFHVPCGVMCFDGTACKSIRTLKMTGRDGGPGTGGNVWEFLGSRVDMLLVQEGKRGEIPPIFTAPSPPEKGSYREIT